MKQILLLSCFFISYFGTSQVSVGSGTVTDIGIPIDPYYGYTYSQQIYLASEINASGAISGIEFYAVPGTILDNSDSLTVYIGHTTKNTFDSTKDWIDVATLNQVFVGSGSFSGNVLTLTFSSPFIYNGVDNLVIAIEDDRDGYDDDNSEFYCYATVNDRSIRYRDDVVNPDAALPPTANTLLSNAPNINFLGIASACPKPSNLAMTYLSGDSIAIDWTENGSATSWLIEFGPNGFTPTTWTLTSTKPYGINGLSPETDYDFYIRSYCGIGDTSSIEGPITLRTPCAEITPELIEDFSSYIPVCWDEAKGLLTNNSILNNFGSSNWDTEVFANSGSDDAAYINIYSDNRLEWLISNSIDLGDGSVNYLLEFDFALTEYNSNDPASFDADDTVALIISTDNGITWSKNNVLGMWGDFNSNTISPAGTHLLYDLTGYTGIVRFAFYGASTIDDGGDNDVFIDNFVIDTLPSCIPPSGQYVVSAVNSADLYWTENGSATDWQVEYDTTGFTLGLGNRSGVISSIPYSIGSLTNNTSYDFYVRSICGVGDSSIWTGPYTFNTLCNLLPGDSITNAIAITALPYNDTNSTDSCYVSTAGNGTPDVWYSVNTDLCSDTLTISLCGSSFDTYLRAYESDGTTEITNSDDECGSASEITLIAGADYNGGDLIYILVEGYPGSAGEYYLFVDEAVNPLDLTVNVMMDTAIAADTALTNTYQWLDCDNGDTAITGATMYWYVAPVAGNYAVIIDNGTCSDTSACVTVATTSIIKNEEVSFAIYPNPSTGLFTISLENNEPMNVEIMSVMGQIVYNAKVSNTITHIDLGNIAAGTYIVRVFNNNISSQEKIMIK